MKSSCRARARVGAGAAAVLLAFWSVAPASTRAPVFMVTVPGVGGGNASLGAGINQRGDVVGVWYSAAGGQPDKTSLTQAAMWHGSTLTNFLALPGHFNTYVTSINGAGHAAGTSCKRDGSTCHAVLWLAGAPTDLGILNGGSLTSINDRGEIAGWLAGAAPRLERAAVWRQGTVQLLPTLPGGENSAAFGINADGAVAGIIYVPKAGASASHAVIWTHGGVTDLGADSVADAINRTGDVAGYVIDGGTRQLHATLWRGGRAERLGSLPGTSGNSTATSLNTNCDVVGSADTAAGTAAVLWAHGKSILNLNLELRPDLAKHITLTVATAINDRGVILAQGYDNRTGNSRMFILTPVGAP